MWRWGARLGGCVGIGGGEGPGGSLDGGGGVEPGGSTGGGGGAGPGVHRWPERGYSPFLKDFS